MILYRLLRRIPLIRWPFLQLEQARRQLNEMAKALGETTVERDSLLQGKGTANQEQPAPPKPGTSTPGTGDDVAQIARPGTSKSVACDDDAALTARIIAAYRSAIAITDSVSGKLWDRAFFNLKRDVHDVLVSGDVGAAQNLLRDPAKTDLFYGFDNLCRSVPMVASAGGAGAMLGHLVALSEAAGARRVAFPSQLDVEELLLSLDKSLGFRIEFPNPFAGEVGMETSRGVASYRAVQALYQAMRIASLVGSNARVLEIGAGLGRTAYYARAFGFSDYTIVDIPMTNVAQGYFLGRTLGQDAVSLFGEDRRGIRVLPPTAFLQATDRYDLVVNVDSLPEMSQPTARAYCAAVTARSDLLLSINHETNRFTVGQICAELDLPIMSRAPYWMRTGYVEELFGHGRKPEMTHPALRGWTN